MKEEQLISKLYENYIEANKCIVKEDAGQWFEGIMNLIFPISKHIVFHNESDVKRYYKSLKDSLSDMLYCNIGFDPEKVPVFVELFAEKIWPLKSALELDLEAILKGDPAAQSKDEIMRSYPGFTAIAAHRVAHALYREEVPVIPRLLSEYAHSLTGIDIHPGARIGHSFCIDHGTGIVIGETAEIGNHVKIYQGVTLGGLSVAKNQAGSKRHPSIEDDVVIYAGATILGGETRIGKGSIIGGNTFIVKSVAPNSKIYYAH